MAVAHSGSVEYVLDHVPVNRSPLFLLIELGMTRLFGESEFVLRLPAALAGTVGLAAILAAGRRLYDAPTGLIAGAIMAVAWAPITYSQEAHSYALTTMLVILAMTAWIGLISRLWDGRRVSVRVAVTFVMLATLAAYGNYFGMAIIGLQAITSAVIFLRRGRALRMIAGLYGVVGLLYAPTIPILVHTLGELQGGGMMNWVPPVGAFARSTVDFLAFTFNQSLPLTGVFNALWLLAGGVAVARWMRSPRWRPTHLAATMILVGWLAIPFVLTYVVSVTVLPVLVFRYLLVSIPAAYLLAARGLIVLRLPRSMLVGSVAILTALLLGQSIFGLGLYSVAQRGRGDLRSASAYLAMQEEVRAEHPLIYVSYLWGVDAFDYYFDRIGTGRSLPDLWVSGQNPVAERVATIEDFLDRAGPRGVWVLDDPAYFTGEMDAALRRDYRLVTLKQFDQIEVRHYVMIH